MFRFLLGMVLGASATSGLGLQLMMGAIGLWLIVLVESEEVGVKRQQRLHHLMVARPWHLHRAEAFEMRVDKMELGKALFLSNR